MFKDVVSNWPRTSQIITGVFLIALGSLVIVGWHINSARLMQVASFSVRMHYNAAFCFLLCGIALVQRSFGFKRVTMCLGIVVSAFGALTLSQHLFNVNLGIDQLLMKRVIPSQLPLQKGMAPNTAMCFMLCGVALTLISVKRTLSWRVITVSLLSAIVITSGIVILIGYAVGFQMKLTWGLLFRMAVHVALGFILLGVGLVASVWNEGETKGSSVLSFIPALVFASVATTSIVIWQALVVNEQTQIEDETRREALHIKSKIESRIEERVLALVRMAERWKQTGQPRKDDWKADASLHIKHFNDYQAIEWADPSYQIRWLEPLAGNEAALDLDLSEYGRRTQALDSARQTREVNVTPTVDLVQGGKGFIVIVPIFRDEEFGGFILGVFRVQKLLDATLPEDAMRGYSIAVSEDGKEIYRRDVAEKRESAEFNSSTEINLRGVKWSVQARPGTQLLSEKKTFVPKASLGLGLLLSALFALSIHLSGKARFQAKEVEAVNQKLTDEIVWSKLIETTLMEKELQIRSVIDAAKDAIISVNDKGKITSWNKGAEIIFGYTEEEATGQLVTLLMPEKFRALHHESFGRYLATGETKIIGKTVELEGLRKDGSVFPLELLLGTWKVGEEIFFSGIARDITERKRIEEELHKVNTLLQTVTETTTDLIFVKDRENRLLFANPATLLVIGKRADEAIGKSEFEWHHDMEQAAALRATDLRIMESGKTESLEEIFTGPEGTRIFLSTKSPMRDEKGAVIGLIGLARDITGRKQAENALKESEMWLQKLFESAPDAILVVNRKGRITRVNAVTEKMFGYSRDELVGKPIDILIPEKFREIHTSYRVEYNEKQRLRPMGVGRDVYAIRKNGITFPVSVTLNPISEDKTGDIIAIARDITEHKQAEMKISQSLVEKEALLKEIHHRVKNNMQVISSLLSLQSGYITDPQALGIFEECKQRVQTMALIHEKLYRTQNLSKIDFAEYINDLATSIFATYSVNTEAVILKIDADHAFLKIHSAIPCSLIINELVTNSIKYAFPNGEKGEIRIGFHIESNDRHILTVGDNGVGLPANFDIENAETLGLRLVNILVNQLEGDLEMSNKNGTEFKIGFQRTDKK